MRDSDGKGEFAGITFEAGFEDQGEKLICERVDADVTSEGKICCLNCVYCVEDRLCGCLENIAECFQYFESCECSIQLGLCTSKILVLYCAVQVDVVSLLDLSRARTHLPMSELGNSVSL